MSEIKYGLISETDARTLEKTIDLICERFIGEEICITEIGIFDGQTARGLYEYTTSKAYLFGDYISELTKIPMNSSNFRCNYTAIDNEKDKPILKPFQECNLIIGNSNEVYNQIPDNSQHLIFVDGCHCFAHVISDFFCYAPKVKVGGYFAFHDTSADIQPFKDFQHGDKSNPDAYISVRKALDKIGLPLSMIIGGCDPEIKYHHHEAVHNWELIFDEAEELDEAGGICVFKKLY